jgi:hypothetical protein
MAKEKPSPKVIINARDLRDIIRDELYGLQATLNLADPDKKIKEVAKTIVKRALLSPKPSG